MSLDCKLKLQKNKFEKSTCLLVFIEHKTDVNYNLLFIWRSNFIIVKDTAPK